MSCGCGGKSKPTVETVESAQAAADARRQAQQDTIRRERDSQLAAIRNAA